MNNDRELFAALYRRKKGRMRKARSVRAAYEAVMQEPPRELSNDKWELHRFYVLLSATNAMRGALYGGQQGLASSYTAEHGLSLPELAVAALRARERARSAAKKTAYMWDGRSAAIGKDIKQREPKRLRSHIPTFRKQLKP